MKTKRWQMIWPLNIINSHHNNNNNSHNNNNNNKIINSSNNTFVRCATRSSFAPTCFANTRKATRLPSATFADKSSATNSLWPNTRLRWVSLSTLRTLANNEIPNWKIPLHQMKRTSKRWNPKNRKISKLH